MATAEISSSLEAQSAAKAESGAAAPAPDEAAQEALKKAEAAQEARVTLAAISAPKLVVDLGLGDTPPAAAPTLPATPAEAKEPEFLDSVLKYYDEAVARGKGPVGATFDAILYAFTSGSTKLWDWVSGLFNGKKKEDETPAQPATPENAAVGKESQSSDLAPSASAQLDTALKANPTWLAMAQEASKEFNIPTHILFAFARFESGFNPNAVNDDVAGLGQFWGPTWESFKGKNAELFAKHPELKDADRTDPRASFFAMAWYARQNATECNIDTSAPDAAARLYEAHHNGAGGYKTMVAYRRGELSVEPDVPVKYRNKSFPRYGVPTVDGYAAYAKLITAMSAEMQVVSDAYQADLPNFVTQQTNV